MPATPKDSAPKPPRGTADKLAVGLLLSGETVTAKLLAERAKISDANALRSVKRVQLFLGDLVEHDNDHRNSYALRLRSTTGLPRAPANRARALTALCIARSLMAAFRGTAIETEVRTMIESLLATGSGRADDLARKIRGPARALLPRATGDTGIEAVVIALLESRRLRCRYSTSNGEVYALELEPLTLLLDDIGIHLYANCVASEPVSPRLGERFTYALSRITELNLSSHFGYPTGHEFKADDLFGPAFSLYLPRPGEDATVHEVVLRFKPDWEPYLRAQPLHPSQILEPLTDTAIPGIVARLKVYVAYDLVHWIRGHGGQVEVLAPMRLRRWVRSDAGREGPGVDVEHSR